MAMARGVSQVTAQPSYTPAEATIGSPRSPATHPAEIPTPPQPGACCCTSKGLSERSAAWELHKYR